MKLLVNDKELAKYLISLIDLKEICSQHEVQPINVQEAINFIVDLSLILDDNQLEKGEYYKCDDSYDYLLNIPVYHFTKEKFETCEKIIKEHLVLNDEMKNLFSSRHAQIDFTKTIGFHRRATDMTLHHIPTIPLDNVFNSIEEEEFENIFLMSDNMDDLNKFKQRYGNRLITFDEFSTSELDSNPFFKMNKDEESTKNHIKEIVFGAYKLEMTKKLYCTKSNLSTFSILSNSNLNYKRLN